MQVNMQEYLLRREGETQPLTPSLEKRRGKALSL